VTKWASAMSIEPRLDAAVAEASRALRSQLDSNEPHLVLAFVAAQHAGQFDRLPALIRASLGNALLIGCSAGGVIGGGREIEHAVALSMTAAVLPDVALRPFHVDAAVVDSSPATIMWETVVGVPASAQPHFLLLPDPFTFDAEAFLRALDHAYPLSCKIGGLASGGRQAGANVLFLGDEVYRSGVVGVALSGDIEVETIVAQGCRPVGQPMFATKCQGNIIFELDGQPAVKVLEALYEMLSPNDKQLAEHSLFIGVVMSADRQRYHRGDFLVRNLIGMDATRGALAVGAVLSENSVVQFHLRDARTSADDLEQWLRRYEGDRTEWRPEGALLFSCLGRGAHLYGYPDHETKVFRRYVGDVSLSGFFCNGEIGPVSGTTFLHGYTSAFGLFRGRGTR